jgi:hypothetical protein
VVCVHCSRCGLVTDSRTVDGCRHDLSSPSGLRPDAQQYIRWGVRHEVQPHQACKAAVHVDARSTSTSARLVSKKSGPTVIPCSHNQRRLNGPLSGLCYKLLTADRKIDHRRHHAPGQACRVWGCALCWSRYKLCTQCCRAHAGGFPASIPHNSSSCQAGALSRVPSAPGIHLTGNINVIDVQEYLLCGFDFVVAPLVDPAYDKPPLPGNAAPGAPATIPSRLREELMLSSASWGGQVRDRPRMIV